MPNLARPSELSAPQKAIHLRNSCIETFQGAAVNFAYVLAVYEAFAVVRYPAIAHYAPGNPE